MPDVKTVRFSNLLTNVGLAYQNEMFVGDQVIKDITVPRQTGIYYTFDRSNFKVQDSYRQPGTAANEMDYTVTQTSFITKGYALKHKVPVEVQDEAEAPLKPIVDGTERLTEKLRLDKERQILTYLSDYTTTFASYRQAMSAYGAGTNEIFVYFDDLTNGDPYFAISQMKKTIQFNCGKMPNVIMMNPLMESYIANHPKTKARFQYVQALNSDELPPTILGMKKIIAAAIQDTANEFSSSETNAYLFGNVLFMGYAEPSPGIWKPSVGYCFQNKPFKMRTWFDDELNSTWIEGSWNYLITIIAPRCGYVAYDLLTP